MSNEYIKMNRLYISFLLIVGVFSIGTAQDYVNQKFDRQFILMPRLGEACDNLDTSNHVYINATLLDFNTDSLQMSPLDTFAPDKPVPYFTINQCAEICDRQGRIAAYFNGADLWDRNKHSQPVEVFRHASSWGPFQLSYLINSCLMLPIPSRENHFVIIGPTKFQYEPDTNYRAEAGTQISAAYFRQDTVDGSLGIYRVDSNLHAAKYVFSGAMTACRHSNGRDWWIACPERFGKIFHLFLLTPDGLIYSHDSEVSDLIYDFSIAPMFSPDGRYYTRTDVITIDQYRKKNYVQIFGFDRCTGMFSDPVSFQLPQEDTSSIGQAIFDASSRYLYLTSCASLFQVDMQASDIPGSLIKVSGYDRSIIDQLSYLCIGFGILAPDGKMYFADGRNSYRMTVVNNPSAPGLACDARYAAIMKPSCFGGAWGNMPDYNLGPLDGSPCDTLGLDAVSLHRPEKSSRLEIAPSPTRGEFTVWLPSQEGRLSITDMQGIHIRQIPIERYAMEQRVILPRGIYLLTYQSADGRIRASGKVVVF
jgi:hypothetical protein